MSVTKIEILDGKRETRYSGWISIAKGPDGASAQRELEYQIGVTKGFSLSKDCGLTLFDTLHSSYGIDFSYSWEKVKTDHISVTIPPGYKARLKYQRGLFRVLFFIY